jgi:alpha-1,3-rhamnosyl/mannosyltransferase
VICASEHSREATLELCGLDPAQVVTVNDGVAPGFLEPIAYADSAAARHWYGLDRPYIVSLCTLEPRKNLGRLVAAYDRLCDRRGPQWDLVLIGAAGWGDTRVDEMLQQPRRGRVILPGRVSQAQLPPLLAGAQAMAFVSLGEGFGLPPLEAMAVGCPVVASNTTSLPEVVGDAGLLVDPKDIDAISDALERILSDTVLAAELSAKGRARAARFTWLRTARETAEVYKQAVG